MKGSPPSCLRFPAPEIMIAHWQDPFGKIHCLIDFFQLPNRIHAAQEAIAELMSQ